MRFSGYGLLIVVFALLVRSQGDAVTAAPLAATCTPRPAISVNSVANGQGVVQVTISASTAAGSTLQQLQFESANGALIDVPGQRQGQTGNFTVDMANQTTATFTIR